MCTVGAPVNTCLNEMVKPELGDHHQQILCPVHKVELIWHNAFITVELNTECENDSLNRYYYFKCANLKGRLFKWQAIFMGEKRFKYKQATGTHWVEHQVDALERKFKKSCNLSWFC